MERLPRPRRPRGAARAAGHDRAGAAGQRLVVRGPRRPGRPRAAARRRGGDPHLPARPGLRREPGGHDGPLARAERRRPRRRARGRPAGDGGRTGRGRPPVRRLGVLRRGRRPGGDPARHLGDGPGARRPADGPRAREGRRPGLRAGGAGRAGGVRGPGRPRWRAEHGRDRAGAGAGALVRRARLSGREPLEGRRPQRLHGHPPQPAGRGRRARPRRGRVAGLGDGHRAGARPRRPRRRRRSSATWPTTTRARGATTACSRPGARGAATWPTSTTTATTCACSARWPSPTRIVRSPRPRRAGRATWTGPARPARQGEPPASRRDRPRRRGDRGTLPRDRPRDGVPVRARPPRHHRHHAPGRAARGSTGRPRPRPTTPACSSTPAARPTPRRRRRSSAATSPPTWSPSCGGRLASRSGACSGRSRTRARRRRPAPSRSGDGSPARPARTVPTSRPSARWPGCSAGASGFPPGCGTSSRS